MSATAVTAWVAEVLFAGWRRQETEGRYRGGDDFRALHIDPNDAMASWRALRAQLPDWPADLAEGMPVGALPGGLGLTRADRFVALLALAVEYEPRLRPLVAALTDDPALRLPTLGLALELAGAAGLDARDVRAAVDPDARLAFVNLVRAVSVEGRPSELDAALVASRWLIAATAGGAPEPAELVWLAGTAHASVSGRPAVALGADDVSHAEQTTSGPVALLRNADDQALRTAVRTCLHRGAALVVACDARPERWLVDATTTATTLGCPMTLSLAPGIDWVAPAGWSQHRVVPADAAERHRRWTSASAAAGLDAAADDLMMVASEFALGRDRIDETVTRVAVAGGPRVDLAGLRSAARMALWHDLGSCARRGPTGNTWDDLVVPTAVRRQLNDVARSIAVRGQVLDEWGFGSRPGSRGYHVLFAGPSGTGKTMSAGVIAEATGLELWVVDLARVVDKYLGETEKAIDRVLRAAEGGGAMLLFDEADALFGRRGEVREAKDRWANVEVAFLLQRIEEHDGVTVLTTNVSHHLDEAFARRMSQRVEFGPPDAGLRRTLWQRSVPVIAPLADPEDLSTVADRFELAGGSIRTAALNAAYEAAAEGQAIELAHLVRAAVRELTKAGRAPTRTDLGPLAEHLAAGSVAGSGTRW